MGALCLVSSLYHKGLHLKPQSAKLFHFLLCCRRASKSKCTCDKGYCLVMHEISWSESTPRCLPEPLRISLKQPVAFEFPFFLGQELFLKLSDTVFGVIARVQNWSHMEIAFRRVSHHCSTSQRLSGKTRSSQVAVHLNNNKKCFQTDLLLINIPWSRLDLMKTCHRKGIVKLIINHQWKTNSLLPLSCCRNGFVCQSLYAKSNVYQRTG